MKQIAKLFLSVITAVILIIPVGAVSNKATDKAQYSITINNKSENHIYEAYQIFSGDISSLDGSTTESSKETLISNIAWGSGIKADDIALLGDAKTAAENLKDVDSAKEFSKKISEHLDLTKAYTSQYNRQLQVHEINNLQSGYYLIKDKDKTQIDAYTQYIMQVVDNVNVNPKSDVPKIVKKVKDTNDSVDGENQQWQDSADYDIGDFVPFKLDITLPNNVSEYSKYHIKLYDKMSQGFTFNNTSVVIKLDGQENINGKNIKEYFNIEYLQNTNEVIISCDNVKEFGATNNSLITVEYTAKLNENANIGSEGNVNEVYLEYSNNPNPNQENSTASTPKDQVKVFTYKLIINKVDGEDKALEGASFKLYKKNNKGEFVAISEIENGPEFVWNGLDDGEYKIEETKTPKGYNSIEPIIFKIKAEHETNSDNPQLISIEILNGKDLPTNSVDKQTGTITTKVVNKAGLRLPKTGGIGSVIFYIAGISLITVSTITFIRINRKNKNI